MTELMVMQNPGGRLPDNITDVQQSKKCPLCRGAKYLKRLDSIDKTVECHRCGGIGKMHETGGQSQTRARKLSEGLAPEELNALAKNLTDLQWQALRWVVNGDQGCFAPLHAAALQKLNRTAEEEEWTYQESAKHPKLQCLAALALFELQSPGRFNGMEERGKVMHIHPRTFERTWMDRYVRLCVHVNHWYKVGSDRVNRAYRQAMEDDAETDS